MNIKTVLQENDLPEYYYNILADLKNPLPPVLNPGTKEPVGPDDLSPLFPMELIGQEAMLICWLALDFRLPGLRVQLLRFLL